MHLEKVDEGKVENIGAEAEHRLEVQHRRMSWPSTMVRCPPCPSKDLELRLLQVVHLVEPSYLLNARAPLVTVAAASEAAIKGLKGQADQLLIAVANQLAHAKQRLDLAGCSA
eukprot:1941415-Pleurochrysis_carterae.AAC.1